MHTTRSIQHLIDLVAINGSSLVFISNRHSIKATKIGNVYIGGRFFLNDVLYMPDFKCNLISIAQLIDCLNCQVTFKSELYLIQDHTSRKTISVGELQWGIYYLRRVATKTLAHMAMTHDVLWHQTLGHPSRQIWVQGINLCLGKDLNKDCAIFHKAK